MPPPPCLPAQVLWTTKAITQDIFAVLMQRAPAGMDVEGVRAALAQVRSWGAMAVCPVPPQVERVAMLRPQAPHAWRVDVRRSIRQAATGCMFGAMGSEK